MGLFDTLNAADSEKNADEERLRFMAQDPNQANALAYYDTAGAIGKGLGQAALGLAGQDPRTPQEKLKDAMKGIATMGAPDMSTPEGLDTYYKGVISHLSANGLPAAAYSAAQEWNDAKMKMAHEKLYTAQAGWNARRTNATGKNAVYGELQDTIDELADDPTNETLLSKKAALERALGIIKDPTAGASPTVGVTPDGTFYWKNGSNAGNIIRKGGGSPLSDPDTANFWYEFYAKNKTLPPMAWGQAGNPTREAFLQGFPKWQAEHGGGGGAATAAGQADFHANAGALNMITKDYTAFKPYKDMLDTNADVAVELGKKLKRFDSKIANRSINWLAQNMSNNPDVAEYLAQIHFVQIEAARVITNPRIVGPLTDTAQREMQAVIDGNAPVEVVERVLRRLQADGKNRFKAMMNRRDELIANMAQSAPETNPTPAAPAAAPAEDRVRIRFNGQVGTIPRSRLADYKAQGAVEIK